MNDQYSRPLLHLPALRRPERQLAVAVAEVCRKCAMSGHSLRAAKATFRFQLRAVAQANLVLEIPTSLLFELPITTSAPKAQASDPACTTNDLAVRRERG